LQKKKPKNWDGSSKAMDPAMAVNINDIKGKGV
jgi:hypothetical protein